VRAEINDVFERRGLIIFKAARPRPHAGGGQPYLRTLKDHPTKSVKRSDDQAVEGVIDNYYKPKGSDEDLVEINGKKLAQWIPAFRPLLQRRTQSRRRPAHADPAKEGGLTGFADGVELYKKLPEHLKKRIEVITSSIGSMCACARCASFRRTLSTSAIATTS